MKRTIAIVAGGDTSEFHVSLRSAQGIYSFIDKEKYTLYIVEMHGLDWHVQLPDGAKAPVDRNDFSFMLGAEKIKFDFAYITIHGTPGEDGRLQGYFDMMHIPYSCCGVLAGQVGMPLCCGFPVRAKARTASKICCSSCGVTPEMLAEGTSSVLWKTNGISEQCHGARPPSMVKS